MQLKDYFTQRLLGDCQTSSSLNNYHWLPIHLRIKFKIACITYKTIHTTQPAYLNSVLEHYTPNSYIAFIRH